MGITSDASGNGSPATIRLASSERDAEQIAAIYAPNVTDTVISFETEPPTAEEEMRRGIGHPEALPLVGLRAS